MALDNRSPSSALFKRAEQLRRWQESETNRTETSERTRKVNFSDGCIFLAACAAGDKIEVLRLLEKGADIDTANVDGLTALHAACIDDNLDMVEFLVDQGADVNRGDMEGWTPLHATASCGFNSIAQFLIDRGADLALVNNDGDLCIDIADSEEMEALLQNEVDGRGIDCEASRNEEERRMREDAQRWLNTGYYADRPHPKTGASALHVAAAKGYRKVMNILLESGSNIDAQDFDGWTPLHAAAHWGQREAVEILCENDSDMEVRNFVGQSAFDVADNGLIKLLDELKRKQASRRLTIPTNRKRKTSPNRDSRNKKEKEDQRESDGTSSDESTSELEKKNKVNKENVAQIIPTSTTERNNGRSPVSPNKPSETMDDSEVQSWRRPSSLRNKTSPPDDRNQKEDLTRTISTPARISSSREEESIQRTSSSPEKDERNHVDSMARVSLPADPSSGVLNTSISPPARSVGRSFVPPSRDEESETQRKAHAKMVRSTRRSTQGVTLEDLKSAEQLMKNKKTQEAFTLENVAKSKEGESEVDTVTAPLRKKSTDVGDEEKESERTSQTREGTQAVLQRRKKPKRRSTGRVQVNMDEIDPEKRAARLAEQQQKQAAGEEVSDDDEEEEDSIELGKTNNSSPRGTPDSLDRSYVSHLKHVVQEQWEGMEYSMSHESTLSKSPPTHRSPPYSPRQLRSPTPRSPTPPAQDWYNRRSISPPDRENSQSPNAHRHYRRSCTPPDREFFLDRSLTPPEKDIPRRSCTLPDREMSTKTSSSELSANEDELEKDSNQILHKAHISESDTTGKKYMSLENELQPNVEFSINNETKAKLSIPIVASTKRVDDLDKSSSLDQTISLEISTIEVGDNSAAAEKHSMELSEEKSTDDREKLLESPIAQSISDNKEIPIEQEVQGSSLLDDNSTKGKSVLIKNLKVVESQENISIGNSSLAQELNLSPKEYSVPPEPSEQNILSQENKILIKLDISGLTSELESPCLEKYYSYENLIAADTKSDTNDSAKISTSPSVDEFKLMPPVFADKTPYLSPSPERGAASVYSTPWESPATTPERDSIMPPVFSVPFITPTTSPDRENTDIYSFSSPFKSSIISNTEAELLSPVFASPFQSPATSPDRDTFEVRPVYSTIYVSPATSPVREVNSLPSIYSSVFQSPYTSPDRDFNFLPAVFSTPFKSPTTTPDRDSFIAQLIPSYFSTPWRSPTTSPERSISLLPPVFSSNYRYPSPDKDDIKLVQDILMRPVYSQTWRPTLSPSPIRMVAPELVLDSPVDDKTLCPPVFSSSFRSPAPSPERAWKSVTPSPERYFDSETNCIPISENKNLLQPLQPVYYSAGTSWSEESTTSPERGLFLSSDQSLSERGEGTKATTSNTNSRSSPRSASQGTENGEPDYKKLYEEQLAENTKILERLRISEADVQTARENLDANNKKNTTEKREKRALERKLSEMEEELKQLQKLKAENEKLKAENRALTRVVSKLTNSAASGIGNLGKINK